MALHLLLLIIRLLTPAALYGDLKICLIYSTRVRDLADQPATTHLNVGSLHDSNAPFPCHSGRLVFLALRCINCLLKRSLDCKLRVQLRPRTLGIQGNQ